MPKAIHSGYDSCGDLYVDCVECTQGINGSAECDKGWNNDEPKQGGCNCGTLLAGLIMDNEG